MKNWVLIGFLLCSFQFASAQARDTTSVIKRKNPATAAILSALLPGAGQIYDKKYWKPPIFWAGLGICGYLYVNENNRYQDAKASYLTLIDTIKSNNIPYNGSYNVQIVQSTKNVYRNQRDMYLVLGILVYALNIVDAAVGAHLSNFNVNENLSLNLDMKPNIFNLSSFTPVMTFNYQIKSKKHEYSPDRIWKNGQNN